MHLTNSEQPHKAYIDQDNYKLLLHGQELLGMCI